MTFQNGYAYHISDEYFKKANDKNLMSNKENGGFRPTFYCCKDKNTGLLWLVPMSSQVDKYQALYDKQFQKYGNCLTITIGKYDGKQTAFLLQNMFPITEEYIHHVHTRNNNAVPVSHSLCQEVNSKLQRLLILTGKGHKVVFPDIERLEALMLQEVKSYKLLTPNEAELLQSSGINVKIKETPEGIVAQYIKMDEKEIEKLLHPASSLVK